MRRYLYRHLIAEAMAGPERLSVQRAFDAIRCTYWRVLGLWRNWWTNVAIHCRIRWVGALPEPVSASTRVDPRGTVGPLHIRLTHPESLSARVCNRNHVTSPPMMTPRTTMADYRRPVPRTSLARLLFRAATRTLGALATHGLRFSRRGCSDTEQGSAGRWPGSVTVVEQDGRPRSQGLSPMSDLSP